MRIGSVKWWLCGLAGVCGVLLALEGLRCVYAMVVPVVAEVDYEAVRKERFGEYGEFLKGAERVEVFSLYQCLGGDEEPETEEEFHKYKVLGRLEVADAGKLEGIWREVQGSVYGGPGEFVVFCFWPRHGLRVYRGERVVDYLVCFECSKMNVFEGEVCEVVSLGRDVDPVFLNELLDEAGVVRDKPILRK